MYSLARLSGRRNLAGARAVGGESVASTVSPPGAREYGDLIPSLLGVDSFRGFPFCWFSDSVSQAEGGLRWLER